MTTVIKRGGRRQRFNPGKIRHSIKSAAREAGFSGKKVEELVKEVGNGVIDFFRKKRVAKTTDIRKSIVRRLERRTKSVASAWRKFERRKQGRF